jgi:hypothetical protein
VGFYGRESILAQVDELLVIPPGSRAVISGQPFMLIEGCGGSGRSGLLAEISRRWSRNTPTVLIDSGEFRLTTGQNTDTTAIKVILGTMMRQFQDAVPGYRVRWGRISLLLIAMAAPIQTGSQAGDERELLNRLATCKDPAKLAEVLTLFMNLPLSIPVNVGPVQVDAWAVAKTISVSIIKGLGRSARHPEKAWGAELGWLAPPGLQAKPQAAFQKLIRLSRIAGEEVPALRREVDGLLMSAFLSDLAESATRTHGRPYDFLLLLDNADSPVGWDFLKMLSRTRREGHRLDYGPDPLVVVAAGGDARWQEMADNTPDGNPVSVVQVGDVIRIRLRNLSQERMPQLLAEYPWGTDYLEPAAHVVCHLVYRLTCGHCLASRLVMNELQRTPKLAGDVDKLLGPPWTECLGGPGSTDLAIPDEEVSQRVLNSIARALTPQRMLSSTMLRDLVTLAAARHVGEARQLRGLLMTDRIDLESLFSEVLWSHPAPDGHLAMLPVARHLLLRELASRDPASFISWESVFETLRKRSAEQKPARRVADAPPEGTGERADRLHRLLALGEPAEVVSELTAMVDSVAEPAWLACLDAVTVTPAPPRLQPPASPPGQVTGLPRPVYQLIAAHQLLSDRWDNDARQLHGLYSRTGYAYIQLADYAPADWRIIAQRADYYLALAREIG